jgi:hypothetical protein
MAIMDSGPALRAVPEWRVEGFMTPIVEMQDLRVRFKGERTVHALNGVDITLRAGRGARRARRVRLGQRA